MKTLIISSKYGKNFIKKDIPNVLRKLLIGELKADKNANIIKYIEKNYKISLKDIIKSISENIISSFGKWDSYIYINNNYYIKGKIKLETIINLINYGNLDIKGNNGINNTINFVERNLNRIYRLKFIGGSKLWQ